MRGKNIIPAFSPTAKQAGLTSSTEDTHIASLVIQCQPSCQSSITQYCQSKTGTTVYTGDKQGTFVLVLETNEASHISSSIDELYQMSGVISSNLVYHHCESEHSLEEDMSS